MSDGKFVRYLKSGNPELNIIGRAVKGQWPIDEEKRTEIVNQLMDMIRDPNRAVAVKAARILETAVANDRRFEVAVLAMLQKDQDEMLPSSSGSTVIGHVERQISEMPIDQIHKLLEDQSAEAAASEAEDD